MAWGAALGWVYQRLRRDQVAAATGESSAASAAERADRRRFLARFAGIASVITVVAAAVGKVGSRRETAAPTTRGEPWSATHPLPNAGAAVQPAAGTRPELTPVSRHYRIDINTSPPSIPETSWRLKIHGLVAKPLEWTLADLRARPAMHQFITLSCISNTVGGDLTGTTRWSGVSLQQLLPDLGLQPNATYLKIHSADGFFEVVALDAIRGDGRVMLTYAWDGLPLPEKHGFPLRIYIPDRYGMKQPKWIESIEATDHWEPGYWVVRGWDREARMKATSVIDTIATNMMIAKPAQEMRVPIGGIAHAGVRGISKVELRVDNGEWMPAELAHPCPARLGWYGAATGPCKEASTPLLSVASRGTARRRSHGKLLRTRAARAGSTRAPSCSEETIPNRPELTPTPLRQASRAFTTPRCPATPIALPRDQK